MQGSWMNVREPVWILKGNVFLKGIIKQINNDLVGCLLEDGDLVRAKKVNIFHRNPLPIDTSRNDLLESDIINEPEILNNLKLRFYDNKIYTFVENTLLAINPYHLISELYTQENKDLYIREVIEGKQSIKQYQPHLYSIMAAMLEAMLGQRKNQAIVISGESGAGKTEANKECLRFITYFFKQLSQQTSQSKIQQSIILSNPILQAFGNSRTIRNNNSSRFGKYLSLSIDRNNRICHAEIYNYLLEKSRIISRSPEEQNFHIFYEFLLETDKADKLKYYLVDEDNKQLSFQNFNYTKNEHMPEYSRHPDISFDKVKESLKILPDPDSYDYVCRILSAILHCGNLQPYEDETENKCVIIPESQFQIVCKLLEVSSMHLFASLTSYYKRLGGEDLTKSFGKKEVQQLIHSLSKSLYEKLFQWIINEINISTSSEINKEQICCLGFLDIYGFQVLKTNSLEQLFINYTNQRLHQIYLKQIFKLEEEHFTNEGLEDKFRQVQFDDNMGVLDLIDFNELSLFQLLNDFCTPPPMDEASFITKLRYKLKKHQKFPQQNLKLPSTHFRVRHTPHDIDYCISGFKEKNKDLLRQQIKITLRSSKLPVLKVMFTEQNSQNADLDAKAHQIRKFLSSKFRKQINILVNEILQQSDLHFIRCIKSNSLKKPMEIQEEVVCSQIKYLGILDTIKIKKMGYCIKVKYEQMDRRFSWLVRSHFHETAFVQDIKKNLNQFLPRFGEEQMLYGKRRIFFRDYAYGVLLKKYGKYFDYLNYQCHKITSLFIHHHYVLKKRRKKENIKKIQLYFRPILQEKRKNEQIMMIKAVQTQLRKYLVFLAKEKKRENIQTVQAYLKRNLAVKERMRIMSSLQKIIKFMKTVLIRKKFETSIIIHRIYNESILEGAWQKIKASNVRKVEKYLTSFALQCSQKMQIAIAERNCFNVMKEKKFNKIQAYLTGFSTHRAFLTYCNTVVKGQNLIRTWIMRKRFLKLRRAAITIQRAWRTYYFKKKGAKSMFDQSYEFYEQKVKNQNLILSQFLYRTSEEEHGKMQLQIRDYLSKYKEKMSIVYFLIDFETLVDLDITYPQNTWILNYYKVTKESLNHDTPLQYMEVGQTFTVAANTSKLYVWGLNQQYRSLDNIVQIRGKRAVQSFSVNKNEINFQWKGQTHAKSYKMKAETILKKFHLENGKITDRTNPQAINLIRISSNQRVVEMACGSAHTIFRTTAKKVYTMGSGKKGQLGHGGFGSEDSPRIVKYFEHNKISSVTQVSAAFHSSIVLTSNHKIYWFGTNNTIKMVCTPELLSIKDKSQYFGTNDFCPIRILSSWSRSLSVIGLSILCFNGKMANNIALRKKTADLLISKWQQKDIKTINPPYIQSLCDHLEECHVKIPTTKINIQPESRKIIKQMEERVKTIQEEERFVEISFSNTQRDGTFK